MLVNPNPSITDDKKLIGAVITTLSRFFRISVQFVVSGNFENIYRQYGCRCILRVIYMFFMFS